MPSFLLALAVLAFASLGFAQQFTIEQLMSAPFSQQLVAAKNAARIAWVTNIRGERNVYVADAPDYKPRQVTHYTGDNGQPIAALTITPDGKTLVYARGTEANSAGNSANPESLPEPPKQQVWIVSTDGGDPKLAGDMGCEEEECEDIQISPDGKYAIWISKKQLWAVPIWMVLKPEGILGAPAHPFTKMQGEVDSPRWSPDGRQVAFRVKRKDHAFIAVADVGSDIESMGGARSESLLSGRVQWIAPSSDRDTLPRWSADGKHIAFVRTPGVQSRVPLIPEHPTPWSIWVAEVQPPSANTPQAVHLEAIQIPAKQIWRSGIDSRDSLPEFLPGAFDFAGDRVVFVSEQDNWPHLYSIPAIGGQPTLLTPDTFSIEDVVLTNDGKMLIYSSNQGDLDSRHIWRVPVAGGTPQAISSGTGIEWRPVSVANGDVISFGSSANSSGLPYKLNRNGRRAIAADLLPKEFPAGQLIAPKLVTFPSTDGFTIHGQLFVPKQCEQTKCPTLVFTHGGPSRQMLPGFHYMYYYANAYAANQYLASRGYVVLSVNYRLGIMYGHDFQYPQHAGWRGASEYDDVVAGAKYLQSLPNVDASRMGLWGGSYGGFLTAMGLARNSDIFKAGVDYHGVHDWSVLLPERQNAKDAPDLKEASQLAMQSSPVGSVEQWKSPVLLIHGDDDRNVPFSQTTDLVQRLRKQNVDLEEIIFPDEIHDLLLWRDWVQTYSAMERFFDRKLKQRP